MEPPQYSEEERPFEVDDGLEQALCRPETEPGVSGGPLSVLVFGDDHYWTVIDGSWSVVWRRA